MKCKAVMLLAAITLGCLLPFLGKPIHIDDPLFIWTAQHLQSHPLDFYGFTVDWGLGPAAMSGQMQNPPLAAYYLALVGRFLGWSEAALHFGCLAPALAFIAGVFFLGRRFCARPLAASLAAVAAPVFLLSATSLMCDTMMMALWVWSLHFWLEGLEQKKPGRLAVAALLMACCSLTKYFGACLILLLLVYTLQRERRAGYWIFFLCFPVSVLAGYQWLTNRLYGQGLLMTAAVYATHLRIEGGLGIKLLETLAFTGGCLLVPLLAAPLLWRTRGMLIMLAGAATVALGILLMKKVGITVVVGPSRIKWLLVLQLALFTTGGSVLLVLAALEVWRERTPEAVLLFLWVAGTFLFVAVVNWTVSGRNILPMLPAACFILMRRFERESEKAGRLLWPIGISLTVALWAAQGDWQLANSAREAARLIHRQWGSTPAPIYFEGHWGFQYYMEQLGAKPLILDPLRLPPRGVIVMPVNNTCWVDLPARQIEPLAEVTVPAAEGITLMNNSIGAGYYSDDWGPAPFVFGPTQPERYSIVKVK